MVRLTMRFPKSVRGIIARLPKYITLCQNEEFAVKNPVQ